MKSRTAILVSLSLVLLVSCGLVFGGGADANKPHAPMEMFGVGPEMFQDRGVAWVKSISEVIKATVSELGIIAMAVLLLIQNIRTKAGIDDAKKELTARMDNQSARITQVALNTPAATDDPQKVKEVKIVNDEPVDVHPV